MTDFEITMLAPDQEALQEYKKKRNNHWKRMRSARVEWCKLFNLPVTENFDAFYNWLAENYGLRPHMDLHGNIEDGYAVIDEKKYLLFLMKFGS
jgi:hypothetical protein